MPDTFQLETRDGFRMVEFDPDVFLQRNVRILVDGKRVGQMPYPKGRSPFHETALELGGHELIAVAYVSGKPWPAEGWGLEYDLFRDGLSLTDGSTLDAIRRHGTTAGRAYPGFFKFLDALLQIAPGAAAAGMGVALVRRAADVGPLTTIVLGAFMFGGLLLAVVIAGRAWQLIRSRTELSVVRRSIIGAIAVTAALVGVWGAAVAAAALIIAGLA